MIEVTAPAKVNIFLRIIGKRPDGFHDIETVFQKIDIYDRLRFSNADSPGVELTFSGYNVPSGPDNIVYRTIDALRGYTGIRKGVRVHIDKRIPVSAGLGGGSSDSAAALMAMQRLWGVDISKDKLMGIGAELGSDVPFFLSGYNAAFGEGKGELVSPFSQLRARLLIIVPDFPVSTREIYENVVLTPGANIDRIKNSYYNIKQKKILEIQDVIGSIYNQLEYTTFRLYPVLGHMKNKLTASFGDRVLMSGSGVSIFMLLKKDEETKGIKDFLRQNFSDIRFIFFDVQTLCEG